MATEISSHGSEHGEPNLIKRYFNTLQEWENIELWETEETRKDSSSKTCDAAAKRKRSVGDESGDKKKFKGSIAGARPWDRSAFVKRLSTFSISRYVIRTSCIWLIVHITFNIVANVSVGLGSPVLSAPWNVHCMAGLALA